MQFRSSVTPAAVAFLLFSHWPPVACVYRRSDIQVVQCSYPVDEPVLAACRAPAGRWSIVAPCCRDLSGRTGVRRIAVLDEPAAGGAEVIELEEARRDRLAGLEGAKPAGC